MGGILDLFAAQAGTIDRPLQALPRSAGERFGAEFDAAFAEDRYFTAPRARRDMYQRAIDETHAATGVAYLNPYGPMTPEEIVRLGNEPAVVKERTDKLIQGNRAARETNPDTFDAENIDRYLGEAGQRRRDLAASYSGTGAGLAGFFGGAIGETLTPHGLAGLFIPVTRPLTAGALRIGEAFLGNIAKEGAFQAGANTALQAGAEVLDYASRSEFGTGQTAGEVATNLAGAAVIGGVVGSVVRGASLTLSRWLALPEAVREAAPLEVKDAMKVIAADAIYSKTNRLGLPPLLHERMQERAGDAILRGRPVDLGELTRNADTPYTALGTILRERVDQPDIRGLDNALDRVRALPDSELEAVVRETRPELFSRPLETSSEDAAKLAITRIYDSAGAARPRLKVAREQARHEVFYAETGDIIDANLFHFGLDRESAQDLYKHYDRAKGEAPHTALERAIHKWGDETELSALRAPALDAQWRKDVEELALSIQNEEFKGGGSYTDFRGRVTTVSELTNFWSKDPLPTSARAIIDEEAPFDGQGRTQDAVSRRDGPGGGTQPGSRDPTDAGRASPSDVGGRVAERPNTVAGAVDELRRSLAEFGDTLRAGNTPSGKIGEIDEAAFADALGRADFERQARIMREVPTGPSTPETTRAPISAPDPEQAKALDNQVTQLLERPEIAGAPVRTAAGSRFVETRRQAQQYHGTSAQDLKQSDEHYTSLNYYGQGFYTTDAVDVAYGYAGRGSKKDGRHLYAVTEKRPLKILDGEAPVSNDVSASLSGLRDLDGNAIKEILDEEPRNFRQLLDTLREEASAEGHSADAIQEVFDAIIVNLTKAGYDGFSHVGGQKTKTAAHKVVIYFNPARDLEIAKREFSSFEVPPVGVQKLVESTDDLASRASFLDRPDLASARVSIDKVEMSAKAAFMETDRMAKDAATISKCIFGVPI